MVFSRVVSLSLIFHYLIMLWQKPCLAERRKKNSSVFLFGAGGAGGGRNCVLTALLHVTDSVLCV